MTTKDDVTDRIAYLRDVAACSLWIVELRRALTEALDLLQASEVERDALRARVAELERIPAELRAEVVT